MRSEKAVLEAVAKNNRDALANYIGKLESPTESQATADSAVDLCCDERLRGYPKLGFGQERITSVSEEPYKDWSPGVSRCDSGRIGNEDNQEKHDS